VERFIETALNREIGNVLDLVRLFDPDITGMQILGTWGTSLYIEHKKSGLTPLSAFGDGLRRVVMIALTLPNIRKGILLIDEIETAIHVSVLNEVYQWLFQACEKYDIQLFATTHSLEAVDALLSARDSRDGLVAYQLGQADEPAKRFSGEMIGRLRLERGLDIRGGL
jgi:AAA15 family ATPase/GTPase